MWLAGFDVARTRLPMPWQAPHSFGVPWKIALTWQDSQGRSRCCRDETHSEVGTPHHAIAHPWRSHAGHTIHTANAEIPMSGATDKLVSTCRQAVSNCRHVSARFVNPFTRRAPPGALT